MQDLQQLKNKINYNETNQCYELAYSVENRLYNYLGGCKTNWIRLAGIPVGIISISLSFLRSVATIVEAIFKGLVNMCTSLSDFDGMKFTGSLLIQVIIFPITILLNLCYQCIIGYRIRLLMNTLGFLLNPQKFIQESKNRSKEPPIPSFPLSCPEYIFDHRLFNTYFDLANTNQSEEIMYRYIKAPIYGWLKNKSILVIRLTAPFVGIASCLITTVFSILEIAETILKGSLNILGFPFFDQCKIRKGFNQLTFETPKKLLLLPLVISIGNMSRMAYLLENFTFKKVDYLYLNPKECAKSAEKHLNGKAVQEAIEEANRLTHRSCNIQATLSVMNQNNQNNAVITKPYISDKYKWL